MLLGVFSLDNLWSKMPATHSRYAADELCADEKAHPLGRNFCVGLIKTGFNQIK